MEERRDKCQLVTSGNIRVDSVQLQLSYMLAWELSIRKILNFKGCDCNDAMGVPADLLDFDYI